MANVELRLKFKKIVENYCKDVSNDDWKSIFDKKHSKSKLNIDGKIVRSLFERAINSYFTYLEKDFSYDTYYRVVENRNEEYDNSLLEKDLSKWITKDFMDELEIDEDKRDDVENDVYCAFDLELCQNMSYYISLFYERNHIDNKIKDLLSECVEL